MPARGGGRLGDGKGGGALVELLKAMKPVAPPSPAPGSTNDLAAAVSRRVKGAPPPTEQGRRAIAGTKAKAKKQVIKMSAADVRTAYAQAGLSPAASAPTADAPATPSNDFGAAAFRRIARLRSSLEGFVADE